MLSQTSVLDYKSVKFKNIIYNNIQDSKEMILLESYMKKFFDNCGIRNTSGSVSVEYSGFGEKSVRVDPVCEIIPNEESNLVSLVCTTLCGVTLRVEDIEYVLFFEMENNN